MRFFQVDGRTASWELLEPTYRVAFYSGHAVDEWDVEAGSVLEAHAWAQDHAEGRSFALYAVVREGTEGVVRLVGEPPIGEVSDGAESRASSNGEARRPD